MITATAEHTITGRELEQIERANATTATPVVFVHGLWVLPSSWANYAPTWVDLGLLLGTIGFFGTAFLLFLRFLPAVAVSEVKELAHEVRHAPTEKAA